MKKNNLQEPREEKLNNLLQAFERILQTSRHSELSKSYLKEQKDTLQFISQKLGTSPIQNVLLAIILERGRDRRNSLSDIANHLNCSNIFLYSLNDEFEELLSRKIIWRRTVHEFDGEEEHIGLHKHALESIRKNETYVPQEVKCDTWEEFFSALDEIYSNRDEDMLSEAEMQCEIKELLQANTHLAVVKKFNKWAKVLSETDMQLLLIFCMLFIKKDEEVFTRSISFIFDNKLKYRRLCTELSNQTNALCKKGLLEIANSEGIGMRNTYQLTEKAKREFFPSLKTPQGQSNWLQNHRNIDEKQLFYNDADRAQIDVLFNLLDGENLKGVQKRLAQNNMRTGVCCLMYGGPGTGKTATVLELARQTGRDIFQVNLSDMRSKWVGESERNCQQLWDNYNKCVEESRRAPILLLNECDGILTTRMHGAERSVDKMENTMAAIFLENMEKQKGIVIATTNLADNLDPAFERRFIYKIHLGKPCLEARQSIWKSMLPNISDEDASVIAREHEFSGGQIENIARKSMIDNVLFGKELSLEQVREYCRQECLKDGEKKAIGFGK